MLPAGSLHALPLFPLPNAVLFPGVTFPLHVFEARYRALVADVLKGNRAFAIAHLRPGFEPDYYGRPPLHSVCGAGVIEQVEQLEDGKYNLLLRGVARVRIVEELERPTEYRIARCELLQDAPGDSRTLAAFQHDLERAWKRLLPFLPVRLRQLGQARDTEISAWADHVASVVLADPNDRQNLLEELDPADRLGKLTQLLHELGTALNVPRELN